MKIARTAGLEATEHVAKRPTYAFAEVTLIAGHSHRLFQGKELITESRGYKRGTFSFT